MHELTAQDKALLQALTKHRFPDDKKPNVLMLCSLLAEKAIKSLSDESTPEERDFDLSLLCDIMEGILSLRSSNNGQTK